MNNNDKTFIPFLVTLIASIIIAVVIFLPFATATDDHKEDIERYSDQLDEMDAGIYSYKNISMFDIVKIAVDGTSSEYDAVKTNAVLCIVLVSLCGIFAVLLIIFSWLKKIIPMMIFGLLNIGVFWLFSFDFSDRGVLPNNNYNYGIGYYLFYIASVALLAGAVWFFVIKRREKKAIA